LLHRSCGLYACLVMVGQLKPGVRVLGFLNYHVKGIGFLNYHDKKGSKVVVMISMDLDQSLFPSTVSFGFFLSVSIDNITSFVVRCWCRDHKKQAEDCPTVLQSHKWMLYRSSQLINIFSSSFTPFRTQ